MNFAYLDQHTGQKFDVSVIVIGVPPVKHVGQNNTALQECTLQDASGRSETATVFQGNYNPPLHNGHVGQSLIFKLSHSVYKGKNQYAGYWQCPNPQQNQPQGQQAQPQQQPQPQPQPQQQAYQPPPVQQGLQPAPPQQRYQPPPHDRQQGEAWMPQRSEVYGYEPAPHVQRSIQRSVALEAASRVMVGRSSNSLVADTLSHAISFYDWLATGNIPMSPAPEPEVAETPF